MDQRPQSMAQKRARHYNQMKALLSVFLIGVSSCSLITLIFLWPQLYLSTIFDSRVLFKMVVEENDFYRCSDDFTAFVEDFGGRNESLLSVYVFAISKS